MAADLKVKYGTSNQTVTVTVASLTNTSARECTVIDNTTNVHPDAGLFLSLKSPASATSAAGYVVIWAYGTADGGTNYTQSATGSDAGITLTVPPNARRVGVMNMVANAVTYKAGPYSVAAAFGGVLPQKWGIIIENQSGGTLDSTGGNHSVFYQGDLGQSV